MFTFRMRKRAFLRSYHSLNEKIADGVWVCGRCIGTVYDGVYHTPGENCGGSRSLITRCVVLRGCDLRRTPVIKWAFILGLMKRITGVVYSRGGDKMVVTTVVAKEFGCHTSKQEGV